MVRQARIVELLRQWVEAIERGEKITANDLCPDDTDLAKDLERIFRMHHAIEQECDNGDPPTGSNKTESFAKTAPQDDAVDFKLQIQSDLNCSRQLSKGGLGIVYFAVDSQLHREVAVKFMQQKGDDQNQQLIREAEITGRLEHPGVVPVYGIGTGEDGKPFYVMRFIQGESMDAAIWRYHSAGAAASVSARCLEFRSLLSRFTSVCNTVAYAHNRGILHRDIKPENIMLGRYGETLVVDWGLATPVERDPSARASGEKTLLVQSGNQSSNSSGKGAGTPAYMSPEQANQEDALTPATDVYSLGATLFKLLTGEPPFRGGLAGLKQVREGQVPKPSKVRTGVPAALEAICLKAMAKIPSDRYANPLLLASDIENWLADEEVSAYQEPRRYRLTRWFRHHRGLALAAAVGIAAVFLIALGSAVRLGYAYRREAEAHLREHESRVTSLRLSARFAARMMAHEVDLRWTVLEKEASDPLLIALISEANAQAIENPDNPGPREKEQWEKVQRWLDRRYLDNLNQLENLSKAKASSWFIDDKRGTLIALRSPVLGENAAGYIGQNFASRDYFHGEGKDREKSIRGGSVEPIKRPHRSSVFRSKVDNKLKVAFSVPIRQPREKGTEVLGVLAMSVDAGAFEALHTDLGTDTAVLIDTRTDRISEDTQSGLIVYHKGLMSGPKSEYRVDSSTLVRLKELRNSRLKPSSEVESECFDVSYVDPVAPDAGPWMAAFEPVFVKSRRDQSRDTGWIIAVQGR